MRIFLLIVFFLGVGQSLSLAQGKNGWTWGGEKDPLQQRFEVKHYSLDIEVLPAIRGINASVEIVFEPEEGLDTIRLDLVMNYRVLKVEAGGEELRFVHQDDLLDVYLKKPTDRLKVYYRGRPPIAESPPWSGGFTWEEDGNGNHWIGLSCQHEGAKLFMPCLDHPSSRPSNGVDVYIKVPFPYFAASNGRLLNQGTSKGYNYFHWATAYPINNYNINFTIGRFIERSKNYTSVTGRAVPMKVYVLEENRAKAGQLLEVLETSVKTQEKYFGEYPFPEDKIAVVETPYLGMEHQTINAYGNNFQFQRVGEASYDWLLHHELGHEWWGNKLSVGDWADFWINEGLCSYGDMLYYLEHAGEEAYRERANRSAREVEHKRPLVRSKQSTSAEAYQPDLYTKGALVLHSLRFLLGDEVFFPMLKALATHEDFSYGQQISTAKFISFVEEYSGMDLAAFFEVYLYDTKLPKVIVKKNGKKRFDVSLKGVGFNLPVEIRSSEGLQRVELSKDPVRIRSEEDIVIDPNGWYLLDK